MKIDDENPRGNGGKSRVRVLDLAASSVAGVPGRGTLRERQDQCRPGRPGSGAARALVLQDLGDYAEASAWAVRVFDTPFSILGICISINREFTNWLIEKRFYPPA
jgi:hypothetical protein